MTKAELAHRAACEQRFLNDERSVDELRMLYLDEYGEYIEARELVMIGDEPLHMLSEAGDLGVLHSQIKERGNIPLDIQILHGQVQEDLSLVGAEMEDCILIKNVRNSLKYPSGVLTMNGFSKDEYKELCKEMWSFIGDEVFYQAYMMMADKFFDYGEGEA